MWERGEGQSLNDQGWTNEHRTSNVEHDGPVKSRKQCLSREAGVYIYLKLMNPRLSRMTKKRIFRLFTCSSTLNVEF